MLQTSCKLTFVPEQVLSHTKQSKDPLDLYLTVRKHAEVQVWVNGFGLVGFGFVLVRARACNLSLVPQVKIVSISEKPGACSDSK